MIEEIDYADDQAVQEFILENWLYSAKAWGAVGVVLPTLVWAKEYSEELP